MTTHEMAERIAENRIGAENRDELAALADRMADRLEVAEKMQEGSVYRKLFFDQACRWGRAYRAARSSE